MKEKMFEIFMIVLIFGVVILGCVCDTLYPIESKEQKQHECINFVKYSEHYQITPLTWHYRDSFKCVECGKDYKE